MFLALTRPDSKSNSMVSEGNTRNGLLFGENRKIDVEGFANSDRADSVDTKSTGG